MLCYQLFCRIEASELCAKPGISKIGLRTQQWTLGANIFWRLSSEDFPEKLTTREGRFLFNSHYTQLKFPNARFGGVVKSNLDEMMGFLKGSHISDLPMTAMCQILGYLPAKSLISARVVCLQFWKAAQQVTYRVSTVTQRIYCDMRPESAAIVTPTMDMTVTSRLTLRPEQPLKGWLDLSVELLVTRKKLWAHDQAVEITVGSQAAGSYAFKAGVVVTGRMRCSTTIMPLPQCNQAALKIRVCGATSRPRPSS
ncbi:hypothetical protein Pelo_15764 [Pelomyxa schiedti]|nr:hypothetical protein Pelo_15764 [Pelomyxa schiedti]